jgi:hypothetical protein
MNAALPRQVSSNCAIADDPLGLTRIFDPEIQLAQWRRPADAVIASWLDQNVGNLGSGLRQTLAPGQMPDLSRLPAGAGREALAADIVLLAEVLSELLDATTIGFRLLCTYRGPGTEWVEDASVDRRFLGAAAGGKPDDVSGLLLGRHRIETIPPFAVALLKGNLWQGNDGRGIVHRSPALADKDVPRVLLAMDAGW